MRGTVSLALLLALAANATAQVAEGNRSWEAGRLDDAKAAYERELVDNAGSVRALYRLAVLASWRGELDSASTLAAKARTLEPGDPDVRLLQAQLASWRGEFGRAVLLYDSVLAGHPDRHYGWIGLARTHLWNGDAARASAALGHALAADSANDEAQSLARELRRERRGSVEVGAGWQTDSDENTSWWQTAATTLPLLPRLRVMATTGVQESTDPGRSATRLLGELGARWSVGRAAFVAAAGARRLLPDDGPARTEATYRAAASTQLRAVSLSASFAHLPFDETALLIGSGLDLDVLEAGADLTITTGLVLGLGGGRAWVSDGNDRYAVMASLTRSVSRQFFVGTYGRQMGYDFRGTGYFSPGRFRVGEARVGWSHASSRWIGRVSAGAGLQQAFEGAEAQGEWHVEARVGRRGEVGRAELFGNVTNSLERSTTGAYRSGSLGLLVTIGL